LAGLLALAGAMVPTTPAGARTEFTPIPNTGCPQAARVTTCTYATASSVGQFTVPPNVTSLTVTAIGAAGGAGGGVGGPGGTTTQVLTVTPGTVLDAYVGNSGQPGTCGNDSPVAGGAGGNSGGSSSYSGGAGGSDTQGGFCSGGGGGGASFVLNDANSNVLAAAGGGGGSGGGGSNNGGAGSGNVSGAPGSDNGDGGGPFAGAGGDDSSSPSSPGSAGAGTNASAGQPGTGGNGTDNNNSCSCSGGGGGGGGFIGGGGGGSGNPGSGFGDFPGSGGGGGGILNLQPVASESAQHASHGRRHRGPVHRPLAHATATSTPMITFSFAAPGSPPPPPGSPGLPPKHPSSQSSNDPGFDPSNDPAGENVSTPDYSSISCDERICSVRVALTDAIVEVTAVDDQAAPVTGHYAAANIGRSNHPVLFAARDGGGAKPACPGYHASFTDWVQFGFTQPERGSAFRKTAVFTLRRPASRGAAGAAAHHLQVCFQAPYPFVPRPGFGIALHDTSYNGVLPDCSSLHARPDKQTPCVARREVVRSGNGWVVRLTFRVPGSKQDPKALG
jgi:hypothetical protein